MRPASEYRPGIDGLRAIAVLAVFVFHLNRRWLPGGFLGVDIFFVISGYLITSVVLRDCEEGRFRFGRFYQRRIARLLPAFFAAAVATLQGRLWSTRRRTWRRPGQRCRRRPRRLPI